MEGKLQGRAALLLWGGALGVIAAVLAAMGNRGNTVLQPFFTGYPLPLRRNHHDLAPDVSGCPLRMVLRMSAGDFNAYVALAGFSGQPVAHTESLWNLLGMYTVGFAAVLPGMGTDSDG